MHFQDRVCLVNVFNFSFGAAISSLFLLQACKEQQVIKFKHIHWDIFHTSPIQMKLVSCIPGKWRNRFGENWKQQSKQTK